MTGSGDIGPVVAAGVNTSYVADTFGEHLLGLFIALLIMIVIATMFITAEYRRGLIAATLAASPRRGRVLAAKAVVIGLVTFVLGTAAVAVAVIVGSRISRDGGTYVLPVGGPTEARVILGTAAMLAAASVLALAVGTVLRRSVAAVGAVIVVIVLPYILGISGVLPASAAEWVLRVTPAAGFAVEQSVPQYQQVIGNYGPPDYFPLAPWSGFAVLCAWRRGGPRPGRLAAAAAGRGRRGMSLTMTRGGNHPMAIARHRLRHGAGLPGAVRAEWTKLRTVAGTGWILTAIAVLTVAVGAGTAAATRCGAGARCAIDPTRVSLTGIEAGQAVVALLAVLVISGEYSTGMIATTFIAMPRRWMVLAAKAAVLTGLVLAAAVAAVAGSLAAGRLILAGHGITAAHGFATMSLAHGPVARAAAGSVLYLALVGLLALAIAAIVRDPAAAAGAVLGVLYVPPVIALFLGGEPAWQRWAERYTPTSAGLAILNTTGLRDLVISPWAGLGVLAAWAAVALLAAGVLLRLRDA